MRGGTGVLPVSWQQSSPLQHSHKQPPGMTRQKILIPQIPCLEMMHPHPQVHIQRLRPPHQALRRALLVGAALHAHRGAIHTGRTRSHTDRCRPRTPFHLDRYCLQRLRQVRNILCSRRASHQRVRWPTSSRQVLHRLRCRISAETPWGVFQDISTCDGPT